MFDIELGEICEELEDVKPEVVGVDEPEISVEESSDIKRGSIKLFEDVCDCLAAEESAATAEPFTRCDPEWYRKFVDRVEPLPFEC